MQFLKLGTALPIPVIYGRVSPDLQGQRTCEPQIEICKKYLEAEGRDPASFEIITDESSSSDHRPGFENIRELVKAGQLATLVVASLDRLGRSDNVMSIIRDIIAAGGEVISVREGLSTSKKDWNTLIRLVGMSHDYAATLVAERVREGQARWFIADHEDGQASPPAM